MKWLCEFIEKKQDMSGRDVAEKIGIPHQRYFYYKNEFPKGARFSILVKFLKGIYKLSGLPADQFLESLFKSAEKKSLAVREGNDKGKT